MEPVICGCGGKPECTFTTTISGDKEDKRYYVTCKNCLVIASGGTEEEAIEKWNRAMSGNQGVRLHKVVFAEDEIPKVAPIQDYKNPKRWRCGNCASSVKKVWKYCQCCGCRIDWKNRRKCENDTGN